MSNLKSVLVMIILTILVFILTKSPLTSLYSFLLTLISFLILLSYIFLMKKGSKEIEKSRDFPYLLSLFILFLVGSTGWFFSPFFFLLYLLSVILAFMVSTTAALAFIATLVGLFTVNIGEVDLVYDLLVIISFLSSIPLIYYLKGRLHRIIIDHHKIFESPKEKK